MKPLPPNSSFSTQFGADLSGLVAEGYPDDDTQELDRVEDHSIAPISIVTKGGVELVFEPSVENGKRPEYLDLGYELFSQTDEDWIALQSYF